MIDPYRMVVINIITSCLVLFGALFYRFVFPKRKINLLALLFIISLLPCISVLRTGVYESGDFNIHIFRSMDFFKSLTEGNIMPSWASNLNAEYGYPLFIFNYTLPYYIISFFHLIGFTFITSMKLFLFINIVFSAIFAYIFGKNKFKNDLTAFAIGVFYVFFPYHLVALHFKVTIGEILAFTLVPLYFLFIDRFIKEKNIKFVLASSVILGLIAISHIFIAIFLAPITFFYLIISFKKLKFSVISSFAIIIITSLISLYQLLPSLIFKYYLLTTYIPVNLSHVFSPSIKDLLYAPWRFGLLFQGPQGQISYLLGYAQILTIIAIIFFLLKKKVIKTHKLDILFWLITLIVLIMLVLPQSRIIWKYLPLLNVAGPQRLLVILGFITALLAGYLSTLINNKKYIYLLMGFCITTTILNWGQRTLIPNISDKFLQNNLPLSTSRGEGHFYAATKYQNSNNIWLSKIPANKIDAIKGNSSYNEVFKNTTEHKYKILVTTTTVFRENTLYFPGWTAIANGKNTPINPDKNGIITFTLPKGNYVLDLKYEDILLYKISKIISLTTFLTSVLLSLVIFKNKKLRKTP